MWGSRVSAKRAKPVNVNDAFTRPLPPENFVLLTLRDEIQ